MPIRKGVSAATIEHGIDLASTGHCAEALAILKHATSQLSDKELRYRAEMAAAQCGMSTDDEDAVVQSMQWLNRAFPSDSKVLYLTTRYYSELANRAAQRLLSRAGDSAEAEELLAESYQARGEYDNATAKYKKILEHYPNQPGVHYQLGRLILAKPMTPQSAHEAREEFEAELKVNPDSPAAEFMLGDLAWRQQNADEAIKHFTRATQLDVTLAQPYLGLGIALNASQKYPDAITSLKKYVQLEPGDPAGYYQLSIAYARTGNKLEAQRQHDLQLEAEKKWNQGPGSTTDLLQPH
ncbi:MAG TPA: tetratricopeptide repeat protein [Candidatus Acidoferrum sp.]|nr:tetratricopeptide repeat protein [Candidatus Acidoferrum sp.]